MIIVLNGPLGVGKSTLAEALSESIDSCVMLDGDHLVFVDLPPAEPLEHHHSKIALLVQHRRRFGYRPFAVNHLWTTPDKLEDLAFQQVAAEALDAKPTAHSQRGPPLVGEPS